MIKKGFYFPLLKKAAIHDIYYYLLIKLLETSMASVSTPAIPVSNNLDKQIVI